MPIRRCLSAWLVLAILFAQLATAAYACPASGAAHVPCAASMAADGGAPRLDPAQPGLCLQHCQAPSQTLDQGHSPSVPAPVAIPTLIVEPLAEASVEATVWSAQEIRRDRRPSTPHSVLHCCYRI
jgi:hypothetical protein